LKGIKHHLSKIKKLKKSKNITPKTPLIHKDTVSKTGMVGSTHTPPPQTVAEWINEQKHIAEYTDVDKK